MSRITRIELFSQMALTIAQRSTCPRKNVGALLVKEGRILSMGYNGSPHGTPHCIDEGCIISPEGGCIRTQHAEANAVAWAAREGIATRGTDLWTTLSPCPSCAKLLINAGVIRVFCLEPYRLADGYEMLARSGIPTYTIDETKSLFYPLSGSFDDIIAKDLM